MIKLENQTQALLFVVRTHSHSATEVRKRRTVKFDPVESSPTHRDWLGYSPRGGVWDRSTHSLILFYNISRCIDSVQIEFKFRSPMRYR